MHSLYVTEPSVDDLCTIYIWYANISVYFKNEAVHCTYYGCRCICLTPVYTSYMDV